MAQETPEEAFEEPAALELRLTTDAVGTIRSGTEIHARAQALGLEGEWEFEFHVRAPASAEGYQVIREFDADPSVIWVAGDERGVYTMRAIVRAAGTQTPQPTVAIKTIVVEPQATGVLLILLAVFGGIAAVGGTFAAVQYALPPGGKRQTVTVMIAPPGMPTPRAELRPIKGLTLRDELTIGRDADADLNLRDSSISGKPCSVVRKRFARRVRTFLSVSGTQEVQIDGVVVPPMEVPLTHMMRIHVGNYHLRYDAGELPPLLEVVFPDGRCERGDPADFDFESRPSLSLQPQSGGPQHTIPFAAIEHVRVYRTVDQLQRLRRTAGSGTVKGPYARVRFQSGRMLRGRVETADEIERGRFRLYTDELGGLNHVLIIGDAVAATKLEEQSEDFHGEDTMQPRESDVPSAPRLKLGGPGPTAVSSQSSSTSPVEPEEPDARSMAERSKAAKPKPEAPKPKRDSPPSDEQRRYRDRRNRPRI